MKRKLAKNKKAISPVIATVLLIAIVVVIALIVFVWLKGLTEESVTKFEGKNIKLICEEVKFTASYSSDSGKLLIVNNGNIPIYSMRLQFFYKGGHNTEDLIQDYPEEWPGTGLSQGTTAEIEIGSKTSDKEKIVLIPVLIGSSKGNNKKRHSCDEKYGYEINLNN